MFQIALARAAPGTVQFDYCPSYGDIVNYNTISRATFFKSFSVASASPLKKAFTLYAFSTGESAPAAAFE